MSTHEAGPGGGPGPSEEELRAAYEAEIKKVRVEHILLEQIVSLVNLGMRRTGLAPGTEGERDLTQVRMAIEAVRVLLPLIEQVAPEQVRPIRDALSQLQLAYVRAGGQTGPGGEGAAPAPPGGTAEAPASPSPPPADDPQAEPAKPGDPGPAQRSGRLWIPGQ
jgi:hypothetical protein